MQTAQRQDDQLEDSPIDPAWIRQGNPVAKVAQWGRSADGTTGAYIWSCTAGTFEWHFTVDEVVHVVEGSVTVTSPEGVTRTLGVGDSAFFPSGTVWLWHVPQYVRKHAVLTEPVPVSVRAALRLARKGRSVGARALPGRAAQASAALGATAVGAAGWVAADAGSLVALLGL